MFALRALILCCSLTLTGCAWLGLGEDIDPTEDWSASRLYSEAKSARNAGDYETAIGYYEKIESRFPFGPYAPQAQLETAYTYYRFNEPASAIAAADRFIKLHPTHPHVDYAYYLKGLTHFHQGKGLLERLIRTDQSQRDPGAATEAFREFAELTERFPQSKYAEDARRRMVYLRNILARHELHVADYYMRRKAYVAAANRAKYVIENYQRTPAVSDALVIMAQAYTVLDLNELAADAVRVLKFNYPTHPEIPKLERLALRQ